MPNLKILKADVVFLRPEEGGRKTPLESGIGYSPHLATKADEMLGVRFLKVSQKPEPGTPLLVEFETLYDGVDYSPLVPGVSFEIKEGPKVVGRGVVRR